jgi:hypothetical protein
MPQQKRKPGTPPAKATGGKKRKQKHPTQKSSQQRVLVMGPSGKLRKEWRPW